MRKPKVLRFVAVVSLFVCSLAAAQVATTPQIQAANIGGGITLHYVDEGHGAPLVFVHGSIGDGSYWSDEVSYFSKRYRAIAYSRRYNMPNQNPAQAGYSAVVDADDLAALLHTLKIDRAVVIGHSYGAYTALYLAIRHPELVRAIVLAEPPAVPLLKYSSNKTAHAMYEDIETRMVRPMQEAFRRGDREGGVAAFIDYVLRDATAWQKMPQGAREETLRDAHEWDVMMTTGTLFPDMKPADVKKIKAPVLMFVGDKTYPFLKVISDELAKLLPHSETVIAPNAGHQLLHQDAELCRKKIEEFLGKNGVTPPGL